MKLETAIALAAAMAWAKEYAALPDGPEKRGDQLGNVTCELVAAQEQQSQNDQVQTDQQDHPL